MSLFFERFSELCREDNTSPNAVAKKLGISSGSVTAWKKGTVPRMETVSKLADHFHVSADYLVGNVNEPFFYLDNKRILRDINGYEDEDPSLGLNTKISVSSSEAALIKKYRDLDSHGKTMVSIVIVEEEKRVQAEKKKKRSKKYEVYDEAGESTGRVIPFYYSPPAAGYASPAFGEDFEYIEVGGDVPAHADFAVKIDGDSMEPYIMDGSTVYVNRDPLSNGDVGIFFFDGDMLCKQYYRDEWGNVTLLSLNRDRADADRFIEEDSELVLVCYGRVILPHPIRLAVPEEELL